jgi:hypothetical protein
MSTLIIRDIALNAEMARNEMSAVRGGTGIGFMPVFDASKFRLSNDVTQYTGQSQATMANTGVNDAWVKNISANVKPHQDSDTNSYVNVGSPRQM